MKNMALGMSFHLLLCESSQQIHGNIPGVIGKYKSKY